ncbi:MAG TPA: hypothetical protein DDW65_07500 [Firmicutes bacterium]|jgi:cell division protein FtsL|nr:hypothetical protein [Bacillota bacterium]
MILAERQRISEQLYNTNQPALQSMAERRTLLKPILIVSGTFLCLTVANLWVQLALVKQSNETKQCQMAIRSLERESIKLRMEMANLESFERIQTIAQKQLHMKIAGPNDYRWIAAAPDLYKSESHPYNYVSKVTSQNTHIWGKLASWVEGFRQAMAQSMDD